MLRKRNPLAPKNNALFATLLLLGIGFLSASHAQTTTVGSISGTVRDPSGAVVPNAEVIIREENTGFSRTVNTGSDGIYSAPSLPVGRYSVSAAPQGFKKTVAAGLELHVSENLVVNITLEVGQMSETVNVTADATTVETTSGNVSSLIAEKQVTELPLNGRNYAQLALMVPGVSPVTAGGGFRTGGTGLDSHVDMSVNGNGSNQNMWTVDGVNNMDVGSNATLLVFPSIDSIKEFRVERNSFSAEFGQAQGAVINLVTKGGSNDFHGSLFEFFRNDALNANDFFLNASGQPKGKLRYNNFGGNFSGPIIKNRAFFFWSEEWRRERRGSALGGRVPTAAEKIGDFSGTLTGPLPHRPGAGPCTTPGPRPTDPGCFPGNRIPANLLSPAGLALVKVYPDPVVADPSAPGNNWFAAPLQPVNTRQDLIRGDISITSNMNLMVRYINENWIHDVASGNFWGDTPFPTVSSDWSQPSKSFAVKLSNTLSTTTVNEFQFSRAGNDITITTSPGTEALNQEIVSKFPTVFPHENGSFPGFFWGNGGYTDLWHQAPWSNHEDLYIWKDDFSKVKGSHSLKFGALFSHNIKDEPGGGAAGGNQPYAIQGSGAHTGNAIADLLVRDLPLSNYAETDHTEMARGRWHDFEFYGNDTWKLRPNLTFTMGLRYSRFPQAYSADDRISNYIPRLYDGANPLSGLVRADQSDEFGLPRSLVNTYNFGFQPRLGIAWDIFGDGKTALRMGFGRYMSRSNVIEDVLRMTGNPPWTTTVDTGWGGSAETATLADCPTCRSLDTINPGLKGAVAGVGPNTGFAAVSEDFKPPESWQWNLTVSREIMQNTVLEASYVGNHGLHIWRRNVNWNDVVPSARPAVAAILSTGGDATSVINANRRLRGVGPITMSESTGDSSYHGLQLWLNRRFSNRLAFQAAYTWGHAISNVALTSFTNSTSDPFNYDLDRGNADLDRRHTFVTNLVYVLPSFKSLGALPSQVLGDWQINGIYSYFGGTPIDVISSVNTAGLASAVNPRPDLVPGVPIYLHTGDRTRFLNPAAFAIPAFGTFGNLGRGVIRGPAINNVDFSINKNWRMRERYGLQFRAEMFNALNHPNFVAISNNISGGFGTLSATQSHREIQFGLKFSF
jgi:hypothetical protein